MDSLQLLNSYILWVENSVIFLAAHGAVLCGMVQVLSFVDQCSPIKSAKIKTPRNLHSQWWIHVLVVTLWCLVPYAEQRTALKKPVPILHVYACPNKMYTGQIYMYVLVVCKLATPIFQSHYYKPRHNLTKEGKKERNKE